MSEEIHDPIHDRGRQLENLFFQQRDAELLDRIRSEREDQVKRQQLAHASGIQDEAALDNLVHVNVSADSLTAVSLIPLVMMAWADRRMEYAEKVAVLEAAEKIGIEKETASYDLVAKWLEEKPGPELLEAWKDYVAAVKEQAEEAAISQMKATVLTRAEEIAKAAGGLLGLGSKISISEQKLLDELAAAF